MSKFNLTIGTDNDKNVLIFHVLPTNSIYLARQDGTTSGVSPLIRYLEENENI